MVSRAGDDAVVRHILKIPKVTDAEVQEGCQDARLCIEHKLREWFIDIRMQPFQGIAKTKVQNSQVA